MTGWRPPARNAAPYLSRRTAFSPCRGGPPCPPARNEGDAVNNIINPNSYPRRKWLRLETFDYSDPDHVYFVTLCARHLSSPFADSGLASAIVDALLYRSRTGAWKLYAYVLMPDHLHAALSPVDNGRTVSELVRDFKTYTTRIGWEHGVRGALWQRGFYDHVARREQSLLAICEYILANPVRKGLETDLGRWPFAGMPDPLPLG